VVNENNPIGDYSVEFNRKNLPGGVYFYRMQAGAFTETQKLMVIK
jgi:hypothetical protein